MRMLSVLLGHGLKQSTHRACREVHIDLAKKAPHLYLKWSPYLRDLSFSAVTLMCDRRDVHQYQVCKPVVPPTLACPTTVVEYRAILPLLLVKKATCSSGQWLSIKTLASLRQPAKRQTWRDSTCRNPAKCPAKCSAPLAKLSCNVANPYPRKQHVPVGSGSLYKRWPVGDSQQSGRPGRTVPAV
jgi:hypothetical protein